ncbi:MAG TPA: hypothetical protein VG944_01700 [Fimbriimonas sp.]|nr:hypothetical protein [Fimbriimonas sp.]
MKSFRCCIFVACCLGLSIAALGSPIRQQDQKNEVKGQQQLSGSMAQIGTTYTLKSKLNITILAARYSVDAFDGYTGTFPGADEKVLVFDLAIKNAAPDDQFIDPNGWFTAVDDKGQQYTDGELILASTGAAGVSVTLKPGQGLGQPELKDPLRFVLHVGAKAKINKLIFGVGRLNTSEDVMRYMFVEPPKDPAHATNKNFIAPLPDDVRDPSDPLGALALDEGKAVIGQYYPSGPFSIKCTDLSSPAGATFGGNPPDDGKRFVVATITGRYELGKDETAFDLGGGGGPAYEITDTDGEKYQMAGMRKLKTDEDVDHGFKRGEEYSVRLFFVLPKEAKIKHFTMAASNGRKWGFDVSGS